MQTVAQFTEIIGHHGLILQAVPGGAMGAFIRRVYELRSKAGFDASHTEGKQGLAGRRGGDALVSWTLEDHDHRPPLVDRRFG